MGRSLSLEVVGGGRLSVKCLSLSVGPVSILVLAHGTNGSIEMPITAKLTHTLVATIRFFSDWPH